MKKVSSEERRLFQPVDFLTGKIVSVNHYHFEVLDCDERTRRWFKANMGVELKPKREIKTE